MKINAADLKILLEQGDSIDVPLSPTQLVAIIKLLGIKVNRDGTATMYDDKTLMNLVQKTIGRFEEI